MVLAARTLGVAATELSFGGIKDAAAVTSQFAVVRGVSAATLLAANRLRLDTGGRMDRCTGGCMDACTHGCTNGWAYRRVDGWMDRR